ncbi:starch phosphorylase [Nitrosomonas aestuarii]|uniref:Starch phosphorylase n=1 Tax=Nitrosomonas aestuarii TaxID=52441 RepID=A0A1I4DY35_9PROT|nr:alpha-glucan family phosphorylase [Nitrosomonas aestuarii]SFK98502.1 starch phosphorylase [Nitrosomonas aestuarii]
MKMPLSMMRYMRNLPAELFPLVETVADLATDLRWSWSHAGDAVWKAMDPQLWEQSENPFVVLQNLSRERLEELNRNAQFKQHLDRLTEIRNSYCDRCSWFSEVHADAKLKGVAYFSMEFGLGKALPLYAGGLGVLAGDYLKAASDLALPVTAIGLLYQEGYFRQVLDATGWQQEIYPYNDSSSLPLRPVLARNGAWLQIPVELPGRIARLHVWEAQVGQVSLYLLDSNDLLNSALDRGITSKLYGGGEEMRLVQEIVLGIGGWRLIEALGLEIDICHLNEGHAAFVTLERARCFMEQQQIDFWDALWATRPGNVFTTHTPVAAGFDTFSRDLLAKYGLVYAKNLGVEPEELVRLGRSNGRDGNEPFNMAYLAARTCGKMNGVSRLHGEVSQGIFQDMYPRWPKCQVPVSYVTNGVHVPSWDSPWADEIWTHSCGKDRWLGTEEKLATAINALNDETLWAFRGQERADLVHQIRQRLRLQLGQRGMAANIIERADQVLDPNVLTLGFARRFTAYKRPNLLLYDLERFIHLLTHPEQPVQIIVAGKAHPADNEGKHFIQEWTQFATRPEIRKHVVFLEDYDISLAQEMVQGVDVWINTPRRPWEASGTSGMKVLANGGLNLSELDGWWAEAYTPEVGWALGDGREHSEPEWDAEEAEQLYSILENEVVPMFYDRDTGGIPRAWVARMRASMSLLAPQFSTNRMVREYIEQLYLPSAAAFQHRTATAGEAARSLRRWDEQLRRLWHEVHWGNLVVFEEKNGWTFRVQIYLGEVSPDFIQVQVYADPVEMNVPVCEIMKRHASIPGTVNGYLYISSVSTARPYTDFTPRIVAYHPDAFIPAENNLILWWSGTPELP